jgi:EAL domain-containing protein (putative c-di-GMP-specific phosphodiesterase class I)
VAGSVVPMTVVPRPSRERLPTSEEAPPKATRAARSGLSVAGIMQFHLLIELANFRELRRRLGCARAELLAGLVVERLEVLFPEAAISIVGRALVACCLRGRSAVDLDVCMAAIDQAFAAPLDIDGETHLLQLTFGAASAPMYNVDEVRMAEEAEAALSEARAAQHGVTRDIVPELPTDVKEIARDLAHAIDHDELILFYQPKIHVRRQEIGSAEALVRWRHPERGLVLPNDFIMIAEECHLIGKMTLWTIRQAIADQRVLATHGHNLRLFINISGQLLADDRFVREVCDLVGGSDAKLGFEITETSVIRDPNSAIANLQIFADFGITIAIDDYGAGLSSLAYLKQLPARELKIDKLFVTQLTSSNRDPLIVRSTIDLAHALEMEVVAEGVETHAALALLTVMGCDMVQGFLISKPVALDALIVYLADGKKAPPTLNSQNTFASLAAVRKSL